MTQFRLCRLRDINGPAARPGYQPERHGAGIMDIGIGAFHRARQVVMTYDAMARNGGDWRIIGVSLRARETAENLNAQDGLYTLSDRGADGTSARVGASIQRVIAADPKATLDALCDPGIRIVSLTVTEHGYCVDRVAREPDISDPASETVLRAHQAPRAVPRILTEAIKRRKAEGLPPLTVMSCDNPPENGKLMRDDAIGFARKSGQDGLANWIADTIAFPSSIVDRITPASTQAKLDQALAETGCEDRAAIETEPFIQWLFEDTLASRRPHWETGGAPLV